MGLFLLTAAGYIAIYFAHRLSFGDIFYGDNLFYFNWLFFHPSKFSIGPAIFWSPFYILTHNPIVLGFSSVLATLFALILLWDLLRNEFNASISLLAILAIALTTNLLFYGAIDTLNSHALTFFAATVFLALLVKRRSWIAIGIALGFVGLMRTQDFLYGILLFPFIKKKTVIPLFLGIGLTFLPQLLAWYTVTKNLLLSPYFIHEWFNMTRPQILEVLFNPTMGLFILTPITLLAVIGLILSKRYWFLAVFAAELLVISSWWNWWQGASYSGRMFVSSLPILAFGVAEFFSMLTNHGFDKKLIYRAILLPLTLMNILWIIYFLARYEFVI